MRITTVSSGRITTQTLTSGDPSAARTTVGPPNGMSIPSARPVPTAAVPMTKARRFNFGVTCLFMTFPSSGRGGGYCFTRPLGGAARAVVGEGLVDIGVGRLRLLLKQRRARHDHAALTIAALRDVLRDPGLLHLVQCAIGRQALDGGDLLADRVGNQHAAGAGRDA